MRAAPPLTLDIPCHEGWRLLVRGLSLVAAAALFAWLWQRDAGSMGLLHAALAAAGAGAVLACLGRVDATPCRLCWDGRVWSAGDAAVPTTGPAPGRLRVMLDLSIAMLLRFDPDAGAPAGSGVRWIPVSGARLPPAHWQALRRTVYSAAPHADGSPGGDGPRTE